MKINRFNRRHLLGSIGALLSAALAFRTSHAATPKTPGAIEGPFYPRPSMRLSDIDNDLVKVEGVVKESGGEIITLKGVISDETGKPLSGLRVEIWQCDINGKYLHPRDRQNIKHDLAFQGFGHDITNDKGEYSFRTIKPAKYTGRTEHIHVKVLSDKKELLTTQFYIDGKPSNQNDWIFRRLTPDEAEAVSMLFVEQNGQLETVVNIVI